MRSFGRAAIVAVLVCAVSGPVATAQKAEPAAEFVGCIEVRDFDSGDTLGTLFLAPTGINGRYWTLAGGVLGWTGPTSFDPLSGSAFVTRPGEIRFSVSLGTGTPASRLEGLLRNPAYTIGVGYIYNVQTDTKKSAVYFLTPCTEPPV